MTSYSVSQISRLWSGEAMDRAERLNTAVNDGCPGVQSSSVSTGFLSEDSDLSEQERGGLPMSKWMTAVAFELRPERFDEHLEPMDPAEVPQHQSYPELLPASLEVLDRTENFSNPGDGEQREALRMMDPSLAAIVSRLIEMEKMQVATIQGERAKAGRGTRAMRSASRFWRAEASGARWVRPQAGAEGYSALSGFSDLALSHGTMTRRAHTPTRHEQGRTSVLFQRPAKRTKKLPVELVPESANGCKTKQPTGPRKVPPRSHRQSVSSPQKK